MLNRVRLSLGYEVVLAEGYDELGAVLDEAGLGRGIVVTNPTVAALHGGTLRAALGARVVGWEEVPDGEAHKDLGTWRAVVDALLAARVDRGTAVYAFGGGVVGDLAGFAAATVLRGLPLVQLPTTLLAAVDASVGGKTGVNTPAGKNLVGAFHQPALVWASTAVHTTLPAREHRCGLGEVLKHAVLDGPEAFAALEADADALVAREPLATTAAIRQSVALKARIAEADPHERGVRALLNLGHTLGHAIEAVAGYGVVSHGEAVAVGLVAAARRGRALGLTEAGFVRRVERLAERLGLPTVAPAGLDAHALVRAMGFDKKRDRGMVKLVIPAAAGDVRLVPVPEAELVHLVEVAR